MIDSYLLTQLHLGCVRFNDRGYMVGFPCQNPDVVYRLLTVWDGTSYQRYLRADVPTELRQTIKFLPDSVLRDHPQRVQALLREHAVSADIFHGRAYIFPPQVADVAIDGVTYRDDKSACQIIEDGAVVSACVSVRENAHAAEAWVYTEPTHRKQGYGRRVAQAWLQRIRARDKVPFYSLKQDNHASQRLAEALDLRWIYDITGFA